MATLLDIRRRIRSVKSTQQITRAMKMVAAARLRRAQERVLSIRPYARQALAMLESVAARTEQRAHPLLAERPVEKILLVLVTADRGLCGAFNTNLIRAAQNYQADHRGQRVSMILVGRKGLDFSASTPRLSFPSMRTCSDGSSFLTPRKLRARSSTSTPGGPS